MTIPRNDEAIPLIEKAICENAGDLSRACKALSINLYDLVHWCNTDQEVASKVKQAQLVGWASLETEAYRRAVQGHDEPVYFKGTLVGHRKVYSDGLLALMLKARVPGYQPEDHSSGVTVNVNLMPRASTYEEWLTHRESSLALPGPTEVVEGEFVEVATGLRDVL